MRSLHYLLSAAFILALPIIGTSPTLAASDEEIIANATSAAPEPVGKNAAVMTWDMKTIREGTNGFTCMPDDTNTTTINDPMCVDKNGLAFIMAIMEKKEPPPGVGFGYMLQGGGSASNADPYAPAPADGKWEPDDGPHVMIFGVNKEALETYPQPKSNPDVTQPYVMYPGTPYAHLMLPVK
ncbi:MAG TPA: hypothetical protein VH933_05300 [Aestuariivirgaceae bacterium]|jgi:hypothetical protein